MMFVGIDTGGTFTDFVLWHRGQLRVHKVLSTPEAPERAILLGLAQLGLAPEGLHIVHGSTVATNAVLEGKGARVAYVTNRGLGDLLHIGRQTRARLYDLQPPKPRPPVPPDHCLEIGGRLDATGTWIEPIEAADLQKLRDDLARLAPQAVAVNLLFSYLDDRGERRIAQALPESLLVSLSSQVLPLAGEYERGMATWLNAYVGPIVTRYLERLRAQLKGAQIGVMQSSGDVIAADQAAGQAVRLLLSGPAGGLMGAGFVGREGEGASAPLLTFDMGGTSTDVALVSGAPRLTTEGRIAGYPVAVPMVDMHTIGAGGGSIARLDAGGALLVGPESAGARPGPACYGRGGTEATVTDAHVVLGRLPEGVLLGGSLPLDRNRAREAVGRLGQAMGLSVEAAAEGILQVANEHMVRALRVISVQRGLDPRAHILTSFGGAGGLHVCALADALEMKRALVPIHAGVLSALGMLVTPPGRLWIQTWQVPLADLSDEAVEDRLTALAERGRAALVGEGQDPRALRVQSSVDLRYLGQSHTLNLPWQGVALTQAGFHRRHEARYGHALDLPVELVNLRVRVTGPTPALDLIPRSQSTPSEPLRTVTVAGWDRPVPVSTRWALDSERPRPGPMILQDSVATTWVAPGWTAQLDRRGSVHLRRET